MSEMIAESFAVYTVASVKRALKVLIPALITLPITFKVATPTAMLITQGQSPF